MLKLSLILARVWWGVIICPWSTQMTILMPNLVAAKGLCISFSSALEPALGFIWFFYSNSKNSNSCPPPAPNPLRQLPASQRENLCVGTGSQQPFIMYSEPCWWKTNYVEMNLRRNVFKSSVFSLFNRFFSHFSHSARIMHVADSC